MTISTADNCKEKVSKCVHVPDSLTHELQSLNIEQKETVDDIIVELEKNISFIDSKGVEFDDIHRERVETRLSKET